MQILILPFKTTDGVTPLTELVPEALLPVANKPIAEHLVELLAKHHIKSLTLCLNHRPYETEKYFEDGSKWGVTISYVLVGAYGNIVDALKRFGRQPSEDYFCMPLNMVTDLDITQFLTAHQHGGGDVTVAHLATEGESIDPEFFSGVQACPIILSPRALAILFHGDKYADMSAMLRALRSQGLKTLTYRINRAHQLIQNLEDYARIHERILKQEFQTITPSGKEISPGVWIGRNCIIHPQATLKPPLIIGQNCIIKKRVLISEAVIGDSVIIDHNTEIYKSIIFNETYIGSSLEVKELVIKKTSMVKISSGVHVCVGDEVILGDLKKKNFSEICERIFNVSAASILLVLFSPVLLMLYLYSMLRPAKEKYLYAEKRYGPDRRGEHNPEILPAPFWLYAFRSKWRFIHKLPGLVSVIRGDLNLVGNSPLTETQLAELKEDWEKQRFAAPAGLFHIWEVEGSSDSTWKEKLVMEAYYAASRSHWGDFKILLKSLIFPIK